MVGSLVWGRVLGVLSPVFVLTAALGATEVRTQVPDFSLKSVEGKAISLKELLKKGPVLVNFWTTWCKPCQKELPEMDKLYKKYKDQGFTFLAISEDDQRTQGNVRPTVRTKGYSFPVLLDPDHRVGSLFTVTSYPTSFLIAPDGTIVSSSIGYRRGDEKKVEKEVVELLEASSQEETGDGQVPESRPGGGSGSGGEDGASSEDSSGDES